MRLVVQELFTIWKPVSSPRFLGKFVMLIIQFSM
jgi:hypothetical protein